MLASPLLADLGRLTLSDVPLTDAHLAALVGGALPERLRRLSIGGARLTGATLPGLVARFPRPGWLSLSQLPAFDGATFRDTLAALDPAHLKLLSFWFTPLGPAGVAALADARRFTGVEQLWLRRCGFDAAAAAELARADHLRAVDSLYLGWEALGADGAAALAAWPGLSAVRVGVEPCALLAGRAG